MCMFILTYKIDADYVMCHCLVSALRSFRFAFVIFHHNCIFRCLSRTQINVELLIQKPEAHFFLFFTLFKMIAEVCCPNVAQEGLELRDFRCDTDP